MIKNKVLAIYLLLRVLGRVYYYHGAYIRHECKNLNSFINHKQPRSANPPFAKKKTFLQNHAVNQYGAQPRSSYGICLSNNLVM